MWIRDSSMGGLIVFLVVLLIGGGAALYFFKFKKPKADTGTGRGFLLAAAIYHNNSRNG